MSGGISGITLANRGSGNPAIGNLLMEAPATSLSAAGVVHSVKTREVVLAACVVHPVKSHEMGLGSLGGRRRS